MSLDEGGQTEFMGNGQIFPQLSIIQDGTNQEHSGCPQDFCLINHIGIDREVFAQAGDFDCPGDLLQKAVLTPEPTGFCQNRNGGGACCFVSEGNIQIREIRGDQPF